MYDIKMQKMVGEECELQNWYEWHREACGKHWPRGLNIGENYEKHLSATFICKSHFNLYVAISK